MCCAAPKNGRRAKVLVKISPLRMQSPHQVGTSGVASPMSLLFTQLQAQWQLAASAQHLCFDTRSLDDHHLATADSTSLPQTSSQSHAPCMAPAPAAVSHAPHSCRAAASLVPRTPPPPARAPAPRHYSCPHHASRSQLARCNAPAAARAQRAELVEAQLQLRQRWHATCIAVASSRMPTALTSQPARPSSCRLRRRGSARTTVDATSPVPASLMLFLGCCHSANCSLQEHRARHVRAVAHVCRGGHHVLEHADHARIEVVPTAVAKWGRISRRRIRQLAASSAFATPQPHSTLPPSQSS